MTIVTHSKEWNLAMAVIVVYVAIGFVIACLLPTTMIAAIGILITLPMAEAVAMHSSDPHRARVFWSVMVTIMPLVFILFSIVAPIKMRATINKGQDLLVSAMAFVLLGVITTPTIFGFLLFSPNFERPLTRLDRLGAGMAESTFGLFFGGCFILIGLVTLLWSSYVAIPVAAFRVAMRSK